MNIDKAMGVFEAVLNFIANIFRWIGNHPKIAIATVIIFLVLRTVLKNWNTIDTVLTKQVGEMQGKIAEAKIEEITKKEVDDDNDSSRNN